MRLDDLGLIEPFFQQTVQRLRSQKVVDLRESDMDILFEIPLRMPVSGFIFHVSRCGSTLLSNALRIYSGSIVISEAPPISQALSVQSTAVDENHHSDDFLKALVHSYGQSGKPEDVSLIFKLTSWNLLHISVFRKLWPKTPFLILVRDPLEVAVSCMETPPGWLRERRARSAQATLRRESCLPNETTCAQVLASFFEAARNGADELSRIVDYGELSSAKTVQIAEWLALTNTSLGPRQDFGQIFSRYSKDASGRRPFQSDIARKRDLASAKLHHEVDRLARQSYEALLMSVGHV
jgi:hypothetical protein